MQFVAVSYEFCTSTLQGLITLISVLIISFFKKVQLRLWPYLFKR